MRALITFTLSLTILGALTAQEVIFKQELSYDTVLMGNIVEIKYSIKNANGDFQAPSFEDFTIVSGPNVSSQFSMINGVTSQSASYSYLLRPYREGKITIEPATLENGENSWSTEAIDVIVSPNPEGIIQNPRGYGFSQEIIFSDSTSVKNDSISMKLKSLKTFKI